jgi:hypothetical protein
LSTIPLIGFLQTDIWEAYTPLLAGLQNSRYYDPFMRTLNTLKVEALYQSHLHGQGHVERTLLFAALLAFREELGPEDLELLLMAASYHDVGRVDDSYDTEHGTRSATRLDELTGQKGEALLLLQGAVSAHSRPDRLLEQTVAEYGAADFAHGVRLARLLKDADGLDRVRIRDLNPDFLRHESARDLVPFSGYLFDLYCKNGAASAAYLCPKRHKIIFSDT